MPNHDDSTPIGAENAFHPDFLSRLEHQDDPLTAAEAVHGGIWFVRPLQDGRGYGVYRFWEDPEKGDEPFAVLKERSTAYLAAASCRSRRGTGRSGHSPPKTRADRRSSVTAIRSDTCVTGKRSSSRS